jgi:hypothetical protein
MLPKETKRDGDDDKAVDSQKPIVLPLLRKTEIREVLVENASFGQTEINQAETAATKFVDFGLCQFEARLSESWSVFLRKS